MVHKKFILDSFKMLEEGNHIEFLFQLSNDVLLKLNNASICHGKNPVRDELSKYYSPGNRYNHTFLNVWEVDDTYTITADLEVRQPGNMDNVFEWIAIINIADGKMKRIELFGDFFENHHHPELNRANIDSK